MSCSTEQIVPPLRGQSYLHQNRDKTPSKYFCLSGPHLILSTVSYLFSPYWIVITDHSGDSLVQKLKMGSRGFPGGAVVESPPADAGDTGSCPGPGGSHMPRSGWAHEPWPLSLCFRSLCSATGEATMVRGPHTAKKNKKPKNPKE